MDKTIQNDTYLAASHQRSTYHNQLSSFSEELEKTDQIGEIRTDVVEADLDEARTKLLDLVKVYAPNLVDEANIVAFRLSDLEKNWATSSSDEKKATRSEIATQIFRILNQVENSTFIPSFVETSEKMEKAGRSVVPALLPIESRKSSDQRFTDGDLSRLADAVIRQQRKVVVDARSITKAYPRSNTQIGPISTQFSLGEIVAIIGANASGKSTLLRLIRSELALNSGEIEYEALKPYNGVRQLRNKIGYVPQDLIPWNGNLRENLHYFAAAIGLRGEKNIQRVNWVINRLGLTRFSNLNWSEVSGGYKLRFELARAILSEPQLLVLDEPLSHLDINASRKFLKILHSLAQDFDSPMCILMTSQHIFEVESIANRVLVLQDGKAIYDGLIEDIRNLHSYSVTEMDHNIETNVYEDSIPGLHTTVIDSGGGRNSISRRDRSASLTDTIDLLGDEKSKVTSVRDITSSSRLFFEPWFVRALKNKSGDN